MSEIIQDWRQNKLNDLAQEIAKVLLASAKEENWYIYGIAIKKDKRGRIAISDPTFNEIELLKKALNK